MTTQAENNKDYCSPLGPVIGPMVLAGVLVDEKQLEQFKALNVRDSKLIGPKRRQFLASAIKKIASAYKIIQVWPREIDESLVHGINLNKIEALKAAQIINELTRRALAEIEVIVDCPSTNAATWRNYLLQYIADREKIKLRCEHKADAHYIVVGAASILAKVTRDQEIEKIKQQYKVECGSGYPSDPLCQKFLKTAQAKELAKRGLIRESWQSWQRQKGQKKLYEF